MYNHPYNQPTYPGPGSPSPAPTPPLLPHQRLWQRFRQARRRTQWGLGCLTLLLVMTLCTCALASRATTTTTSSSPAASGGSTSQATPTDRTTTAPLLRTPTQQTTPTTSVATPSPIPDQVPTPRPTATPVPAVPQSTPTRAPTQPPASTRPPTGVNGNPWGYNFTPGTLITNPPADFCSGQYFSCIPSFANGIGYVVECMDTLYSKSGGRSGSCSKHGGNKAILYAH